MSVAGETPRAGEDECGDGAASVKELRALVAILHELAHSTDPRTRLRHAVQVAAEALGAETGSFYLADRSGRRLTARVHDGEQLSAADQVVLSAGEGVAGWVVEHGEPLVLDPASGDPRLVTRPGFQVDNLLCVPLRDDTGVTGAVELVNRPGGFTPGHVATLQTIADEVGVLLRRARLVYELQQQELLHRLLQEVNRTLLSSLNLQDVLWRIVDAVRHVIPFDAVGIFLCEDDRIEEIVERGYAAESVHLLHQKVGQGVVGSAVSSGKPIYVPDVTRDNRYIVARERSRSELVVPMVSRDRVIGAFNVENDRVDAYTSEDLERLTAFADQATVAVESARLHERSLLARRLEEELSIARQIQLSFLPDRGPELEGVDVAGTNVPSLEVGGDYYDFIDVVDGQLGIAIGDVSGKGVAAGLLMASFRAALLAEIRNNYAIRVILRKVNRLLYESTRPDRFVTALYGVLDLASGRFTYSSAGHNPALWVDAAGKVVELWEGGTVLGAFPFSEYSEEVIRLGPGDVLVLYTDGVTEATNHTGEEFGTARLAEEVRASRHLDARSIVDQVRRAVAVFTGRRDADDDLTIVVARVRDEGFGAGG